MSTVRYDVDRKRRRLRVIPLSARAKEIIERLPDFDAIFVRPDGSVVYTKGLEAPDATPPK